MPYATELDIYEFELQTIEYEISKPEFSCNFEPEKLYTYSIKDKVNQTTLNLVHDYFNDNLGGYIINKAGLRPQVFIDRLFTYIDKTGGWYSSDKGRVTKRISKFCFKHGIDIENYMLEQLGNIITMNRTPITSYKYRFSYDLNWQAGEFGDSGSCYWGQYGLARPTILDNGGGAIKFYKSHGTRIEKIGRVWFLKDFPEDGYITLFNAYGDDEFPDTRGVAALIASDLNGVYTEIGLRLGGNVYVNSGQGYVIGSRHYPHSTASKALDFDNSNGIYDDIMVGQHCEICGEYIGEEEYMSPNGEVLCWDCFSEEYHYCDCCGDAVSWEEIVRVDGHRYYDEMCEYCAENRGFYRCEVDGCDMFTENTICEDHMEDYRYCERCEDLVRWQDTEYIDEEYYCYDCAEIIQEEKDNEEEK